MATENLSITELEQVVVRFSGDSGDGMQLAGRATGTGSLVQSVVSTFG